MYVVFREENNAVEDKPYEVPDNPGSDDNHTYDQPSHVYLDILPDSEDAPESPVW